MLMRTVPMMSRKGDDRKDPQLKSPLTSDRDSKSTGDAGRRPPPPRSTMNLTSGSPPFAIALFILLVINRPLSLNFKHRSRSTDRFLFNYLLLDHMRLRGRAGRAPGRRSSHSSNSNRRVSSGASLSFAVISMIWRLLFLLMWARGTTAGNREVSNQGEDEDEDEDEDDWEAIGDRGEVDDISFSPQKEAGASSSTSCSDMEPGIPKRRGRGLFLYKKRCLYSEQSNAADHPDGVLGSDDENEPAQAAYSRYGYGHVLVLYDFPPSTRTIKLERLFDSFRDGGVVIRWVNDTVALAVFRTPQLASEAQRSVCCPFKVRILAQNDDLLPQLSTKDLEPPYPRPKTSARTAQRLIAQGMGIKLPTDFGSNELRKQEEARKNRILARQSLKEDAWGSDNPH